MTEDDTYSALMRPTYEQMKKTWQTSNLFATAGSASMTDLRGFFEHYGWNLTDYYKESRKRGHGIP